MRLNLSGNPIKLIRSGAFQRLKFVTNIALSHCDIETVEKGKIEKLCLLQRSFTNMYSSISMIYENWILFLIQFNNTHNSFSQSYLPSLFFEWFIQIGAFDGMSSLLEVKLDRNKLQHLPAEGLFASSLHHVEVKLHLPHPT